MSFYEMCYIIGTHGSVSVTARCSLKALSLNVCQNGISGEITYVNGRDVPFVLATWEYSKEGHLYDFSEVFELLYENLKAKAEVINLIPAIRRCMKRITDGNSICLRDFPGNGGLLKSRKPVGISGLKSKCPVKDIPDKFFEYITSESDDEQYGGVMLGNPCPEDLFDSKNLPETIDDPFGEEEHFTVSISDGKNIIFRQAMELDERSSVQISAVDVIKQLNAFNNFVEQKATLDSSCSEEGPCPVVSEEDPDLSDTSKEPFDTSFGME